MHRIKVFEQLQRFLFPCPHSKIKFYKTYISKEKHDYENISFIFAVYTFTV